MVPLQILDRCFCSLISNTPYFHVEFKEIIRYPGLKFLHQIFSSSRCQEVYTVFQTDFFLLSATFLCKSSINSSGVLNSLPLLFRACSTSLISAVESGGELIFACGVYFLEVFSLINLTMFHAVIPTFLCS